MSRCSLPIVLAAVLPVGLSACSGPTPEVCGQLLDEGPSIELGTGSSAFVALADGDLVQQGFGAQGGDHVWASLRVSGVYVGGNWRQPPPSPGGVPGGDGGGGSIAPDDAPLVRVTLSDGEARIAQYGGEDGNYVQVDDNGEIVGLTAFLESTYSTETWGYSDSEEVPEDVRAAAEAAEANPALSFRAELTDACGTTLTAERPVSIDIGWLV